MRKTAAAASSATPDDQHGLAPVSKGSNGIKAMPLTKSREREIARDEESRNRRRSKENHSPKGHSDAQAEKRVLDKASGQTSPLKDQRRSGSTNKDGRRYRMRSKTVDALLGGKIVKEKRRNRTVKSGDESMHDSTISNMSAPARIERFAKSPGNHSPGIKGGGRRSRRNQLVTPVTVSKVPDMAPTETNDSKIPKLKRPAKDSGSKSRSGTRRSRDHSRSKRSSRRAAKERPVKAPVSRKVDMKPSMRTLDAIKTSGKVKDAINKLQPPLSIVDDGRRKQQRVVRTRRRRSKSGNETGAPTTDSGKDGSMATDGDSTTSSSRREKQSQNQAAVNHPGAGHDFTGKWNYSEGGVEKNENTRQDGNWSQSGASNAVQGKVSNPAGAKHRSKRISNGRVTRNVEDRNNDSATLATLPEGSESSDIIDTPVSSNRQERVVQFTQKSAFSSAANKRDNQGIDETCKLSPLTSDHDVADLFGSIDTMKKNRDFFFESTGNDLGEKRPQDREQGQGFGVIPPIAGNQDNIMALNLKERDFHCDNDKGRLDDNMPQDKAKIHGLGSLPPLNGTHANRIASIYSPPAGKRSCLMEELGRRLCDLLKRTGTASSKVRTCASTKESFKFHPS